MNISSIIGFLASIAVLGFAVIESKAGSVFLNIHGITIVIGGTLAAACICFSISRMGSLTFLAAKRIFGGGSVKYSEIITEVIGIADGMQRDVNHVKSAVNTVKNPFLKEGLELIINGATEEQLHDILSTRIETFKRRQTEEINMFSVLGKFPPAFGLLGTSFGMVALLRELGLADALKNVGPAMATGLVATLYGIATTNFVFIPISENLKAMNGEIQASRKMILEGLLLIKRKTHPILVEEKMRSYLLPAERTSLKAS